MFSVLVSISLHSGQTEAAIKETSRSLTAIVCYIQEEVEVDSVLARLLPNWDLETSRLMKP